MKLFKAALHETVLFNTLVMSQRISFVLVMFSVLLRFYTCHLILETCLKTFSQTQTRLFVCLFFLLQSFTSLQSLRLVQTTALLFAFLIFLIHKTLTPSMSLSLI